MAPTVACDTRIDSSLSELGRALRVAEETAGGAWGENRASPLFCAACTGLDSLRQREELSNGFPSRVQCPPPSGHFAHEKASYPANLPGLGDVLGQAGEVPSEGT